MTSNMILTKKKKMPEIIKITHHKVRTLRHFKIVIIHNSRLWVYQAVHDFIKRGISASDICSKSMKA